MGSRAELGLGSKRVRQGVPGAPWNVQESGPAGGAVGRGQLPKDLEPERENLAGGIGESR